MTLRDARTPQLDEDFDHPAPNRSRWLVVVGMCGVLMLVAAGGIFVYSRSARPAPVSSAAAPTAETVEVVRTDLTTTTTIAGAVGHGPPTSLTGRRAGTLTRLPDVGSTVDRGKALYWVDAVPVPLLIGSTPHYRVLESSTSPGPDVRELNKNLRQLGYAGVPASDKFTAGTGAAVKRWQKSLGMADSGKLEVGDVIVLPEAVRVEAFKAQPGTSATAELLSYTGVTQVISVTVDQAKVDAAALKPGGKVEVRLRDGKTAPATVRTLGPAPAEQENTGGGGSRLLMTVVPDQHDALGGIESGQVDVVITGAQRTKVLVVPVGALLALAEGGYGVQVVENGQTRLIAVRTGLFAGAQVEVSGDGLAEGQKVVRAS